ncbi:hypothetical protein RV18_GL002979 [Enterococcus termitis]|nr:hypothetical protein RV18_GL002979 [Enterococcus termitis]
MNGFSEFQKDMNDHNILDINGGVPILNIPGIIHQDFYEEIGNVSVRILGIIYKVVNETFSVEGKSLFKKMGFNEDEIDVFLKTFGDNTNLMSRCDVMLDQEKKDFKILEFNVDSSVGGMEIAQVNEHMLRLSLYKDYFNSNDFYFVDPLEEFAKMLYKNSKNMGVKTIAIVDSEEYIDGYVWSLGIMKSYLEKKGFSVVIGTQKDLELRDDFLFVNNKKIDLVYRVFLNEDVKSNYSSLLPMYEAYKNDNLIIVSGLHTEIYSNKIVFAMMYDKNVQSILSSDDVKLIEKCIPYTGLVEIGIKNYLIKNRDKLVLKPVSGYGGHGIYLGWEYDEDAWEEVISQIIEDRTKYIFQERVYPAEEFQLKVVENRCVSEKYISTWGFYIFDNKLCGSMYRGQNVSSGEVVNAAQGAGMTSVFIEKEDL